MSNRTYDPGRRNWWARVVAHADESITRGGCRFESVVLAEYDMFVRHNGFHVERDHVAPTRAVPLPSGERIPSIPYPSDEAVLDDEHDLDFERHKPRHDETRALFAEVEQLTVKLGRAEQTIRRKNIMIADLRRQVKRLHERLGVTVPEVMPERDPEPEPAAPEAPELRAKHLPTYRFRP